MDGVHFEFLLARLLKKGHVRSVYRLPRGMEDPVPFQSWRRIDYMPLAVFLSLII